MSGVLLIGASGLAREVLAAGLENAIGLLDDDATLQGTEVGGVPVVGPIAAAADQSARVLVCIGPSASRRSVVDRLRHAGVTDDRFSTFVAASARVGATSRLSPGTIVLDGVVVTADVTIGRHVVLMPHTVVTHDDVLGDFVTLAAGVALGGGVRLGEGVYIGMNASIHPGITVGAGATVGMGAAVVDDVPPAETWAGVPARALGVHA
ncbi:NeuD/PglB/VioB family sugar acetyltransferase [Microbacterium sp. Sa4CUA7]|uniref:NeuD/PglB/VioB family sugar acetyltransferase n=1 Tax=Microbacterium pullorum TaxID=2762236 RepID=A0ABR8S510_9MICO|nr:NeuD/PglB/VioB family sugar acetyltransferase [Microbacterium pullorum]MBD7958556.1 NeuD/PglB/VioB family sugar acetyltransferase [Microbacterium pullorum]